MRRMSDYQRCVSNLAVEALTVDTIGTEQNLGVRMVQIKNSTSSEYVLSVESRMQTNG